MRQRREREGKGGEGREVKCNRLGIRIASGFSRAILESRRQWSNTFSI